MPNFLKIFSVKDNFFLEIQDHGLEVEKKIVRQKIDLSKKHDIPMVATNDAHYLSENDARAQEVLMCIGEGKTINDGTRTVFGNSNFFLRSAEDMWRLFGQELPECSDQHYKNCRNVPC